MGEVTIIKHAKATIHSYTAPENGGLVTSQIIEMPNSIVIVDTQYAKPFSEEVLHYAENLKKPIIQVIVTHVHPDHWFGLETFKDYPTYALPEVIEQIEKMGDFFIQIKNANDPDDIFPNVKSLPKNKLGLGTQVIDGLKFEFEAYTEAAEAPSQLVIKLPELRTIIAQDIVFNQAHLYLGQNMLFKSGQ